MSLIFFAAATGFFRGMVPNDILAVLGVAVTLDVVVASEGARDQPASAMRGLYPVLVCVHALSKAVKAGPAPRVNLV